LIERWFIPLGLRGLHFEVLGIFPNFCSIFHLLAYLRPFDLKISVIILFLLKNEEQKSRSSDRSDKGKFIGEEKRKRTSHRTRIGMDFDPKTFKLHDQEAVDKYLTYYGFRRIQE